MTKLSGKRKGTICCILKLAVVLVLTMSTLRDNTRVATLTHPMSENDSSYSPVATRQESFALALKQSYGFFTDITETQWRLAQTIHAKTFPNQFREYPSEYSGGTFLERHDKTIESHKWYAENFHEEFQCAGARRIPSRANGDGAKWICDPHRIAQQQDCLVYSFGSFGNTDFEHGIKEEIGEHCEIHTFDVLTHNLENGNFEERLRSVGAYFHRWGLRTEDQAGASPRSPTSVPMYTLKQIIQMLNHTSRVIDIFRIDCEWCEWDIFPQALQAGDIRQILVETHMAPMPHAVNFFHSLHDAGFVIFSKEANFLWQGRNVEYGFLKLHPDFFINSSLYSKRPSSVYHIESAPIVAENNTKISVVLRTWYEDAELAFTAATSAIQAMGDDMLELVIVTDEGSDKVVRRHLFDPLRKQYNGLVKLHVEKTLLRDGHIQQQFSKIMADTYTKGNLILHLDSDCAVVKWSEDCYLEGGLPVNDFGTFKSLEAHGVGIWKRGTEVALGIDDEENEYSRLNQHVYPRQAYELARRRMEKVHGVPFVKTFQKANFVGYAPQIHEPNVTLFSEFNVIGAAVFHFAPELMFHKNVTAGSNERWRPICITQCSARHFSKKCCEAWFQVQSLQKDKGSIQHHIPDDYCSSLGF